MLGRTLFAREVMQGLACIAREAADNGWFYMIGDELLQHLSSEPGGQDKEILVVKSHKHVGAEIGDVGYYFTVSPPASTGFFNELIAATALKQPFEQQLVGLGGALVVALRGKGSQPHFGYSPRRLFERVALQR